MSGLSDKILVRLMGRENDITTSLRNTIGHQLGTAVTAELPASQAHAPSLWPSRHTANLLVDAYFAKHIQHYYPILQRSVLMDE